jgi:hypothetical protein
MTGVFPYKDETKQRYSFDWSAVKYKDLGNGDIDIVLPTIRDRGPNGNTPTLYQGMHMVITKKVGPMETTPYEDDNLVIQGEILSITDRGVLFLLGVKRRVA